MTEWDGTWNSLEELEFETRTKLWEKFDLYTAARKKNRDRAFADYLRRRRALGTRTQEAN